MGSKFYWRMTSSPSREYAVNVVGIFQNQYALSVQEFKLLVFGWDS
jgi:hypothetical protein